MDAGASFKLICSFPSDLNADIKWVTPSGSEVSSRGLAVIEVERASTFDAGLYSCLYDRFREAVEVQGMGMCLSGGGEETVEVCSDVFGRFSLFNHFLNFL